MQCTNNTSKKATNLKCERVMDTQSEYVPKQHVKQIKNTNIENFSY